MINFQETRKTLRRLIDRFIILHSKKKEKIMIEEFTDAFPGRCMICSYHRFGRQEGLTNEPLPPKHKCIE